MMDNESPSKGSKRKATGLLDDRTHDKSGSESTATGRVEPGSRGDHKPELRSTIGALREEIERQKEVRDELLAKNKITVDDARKLTDEHIDRLHRYNDVKDAGQILFGKLAEFNGKLVKDIYKDHGVDLED